MVIMIMRLLGQVSKLTDLLNHARDYQMGNGVGLYLYGRLTDDQIAYLQRDTFKQSATPGWKRAGYSKLTVPQDLRVF